MPRRPQTSRWGLFVALTKAEQGNRVRKVWRIDRARLLVYRCRHPAPRRAGEHAQPRTFRPSLAEAQSGFGQSTASLRPFPGLRRDGQTLIGPLTQLQTSYSAHALIATLWG